MEQNRRDAKEQKRPRCIGTKRHAKRVCSGSRPKMLLLPAFASVTMAALAKIGLITAFRRGCFGMNFYIYKALLLRVVDADSVDVRVDVGFSIFVDMKLRLLGINAPEMSTPEGKEAKAALEALIPVNSPLIIETFKDRREKYGRYLATLLFNDMNVNTWLVENHYAVPYMV